MATVSITRKINVRDPASVPYSLPAAGSAVGIGTNTFNSIAPVEFAGSIESSWNGSVFHSFGGGTFVDDYSPMGAWVTAGSGGHNHAENPGAAIFDFSDATFKLLRPADPLAEYRTLGASGYNDELETNGAPWYEITGSDSVPIPPHPYGLACPVPTRLGGGVKGSVVLITRAAIGNSGLLNATSCHMLDLDTGVWRRASDSQMSGAATDSMALFDPDRDRYWHFTTGEHNRSNVRFLHAGGATADLWVPGTTSPNWSGFPSSQISMSSTFLHNGYLCRPGANQTSLYVFNPDNPAAGWVGAPLAGSFTIGVARDVFAPYRGKFYRLSRVGGNTLQRLTPPVGDPQTGTWVADTVTIDTTLPDIYGETLPWKNGVFYVPGIDCLARVCGTTHPVYIIRPE